MAPHEWTDPIIEPVAPVLKAAIGLPVCTIYEAHEAMDERNVPVKDCFNQLGNALINDSNSPNFWTK